MGCTGRDEPNHLVQASPIQPSRLTERFSSPGPIGGVVVRTDGVEARATNLPSTHPNGPLQVPTTSFSREVLAGRSRHISATRGSCRIYHIPNCRAVSAAKLYRTINPGRTGVMGSTWSRYRTMLEDRAKRLGYVGCGKCVGV